jgi:hypothetical protein
MRNKTIPSLGEEAAWISLDYYNMGSDVSFTQKRT